MDKKCNISPEEFVQKLEQYSIDDFLDENSEPIRYWANLIEWDYKRYKNYRSYIRKKFEKEDMWLDIQYNCAKISDPIITICNTYRSIKAVLDLGLGFGTAEILPIMCGLGKSSAISYMIRDVIEGNEFPALQLPLFRSTQKRQMITENENTLHISSTYMKIH